MKLDSSSLKLTIMGLLNSNLLAVGGANDVISKVTITTDDGKEIRGIIGSKPHMYLNQKHAKVYRYQRHVY